jgi:hypothetical protein
MDSRIAAGSSGVRRTTSAPTGDVGDRGREGGPRGFEQRRVKRCHGLDEVVEQGGAVGRRGDAGAHPAVTGQQVDPVACPGCQRSEQEGRVHGSVEAGHVADASRRRAGGVEDEDDAPVALGLPGAHDDIAPSSGGPPVDRADIVAVDIVTQRVELGALPTRAHRRSTIYLSEGGQP